MSADLPLEAIGVRNNIALTAEALASSQGLCEFRPHVDVHMSAEFNLDFSSFHRVIDHLLYATRVQGIHHITEPLLVNVDPVPGVWQVFKHSRFSLGVF